MHQKRLRTTDLESGFGLYFPTLLNNPNT